MITSTLIADNHRKYKLTNTCIETSADVDSSVEYRYYYRFKHRNSYYIVSKKSKNFEIDCHNYYTCRNFKTTYDNIRVVMINARVAVKLETSA